MSTLPGVDIESQINAIVHNHTIVNVAIVYITPKKFTVLVTRLQTIIYKIVYYMSVKFNFKLMEYVMSKIVVVGANHAGTACINTILDNYKGNEVVVFDSNSNISFLGCGMALWIGGQIDSAEGLFYSNKETLEGKGATIHMQTSVDNIDFDKRIVYAKGEDGKTYEECYDKLVMATGSWPIEPNIPGKDLENVQFVKLYQHAAEVIEKLDTMPDIKNVTIVGAGYIGVELAEAFARNGKNTTLVDIAQCCLSTYYDDEFNGKMRDVLAKGGINLEFDQKVLEIKGDKKVTAVVTDKKEIPADMVVLAIGFKPNTALGKDAIDTLANGAYRVNLQQETSLKDVYAIGDCATVYDNAVRDTNYIALATNAVRSGIVAGHNVGGTPLSSVGVQGSNGICIFGYSMVSTGLTLAAAKKRGFDVECTDFTDNQKPEFSKDNHEVSIRIVYDKATRRILGAQMASYHDISMGIHMFSLAIQEGVTIDKLKLLDIFFLPHFNKPYNYITMAAISAK